MTRKPARERADVLLVQRGLAASREQARALILAGKVELSGRRVEKAGDLLPHDAQPRVLEPMPYVSRGGIKLAHALDRFGVVPEGRRCLDAGSSTGGFTDCLLQRGAAHVTCVDVGEGQLDWGLRNDPRVTVREGVNARDLGPGDAGSPPPSLVVADLAFISLAKVLPALRRAAPEAELVVLVKPQFEVGRERVGKGGVVRDPAAWLDALRGVARSLESLGCAVRGACASPLTGPAGNHEFFLHGVPAPDARPVEDAALQAAVAEAQALSGPARGRE